MKKKSVVQNAVMKHINEHSSLYVFITVLFLMGVIFGAIVVNSLSFTQKEDLFYYLSQFFGQVSKGNCNDNDIFIQSISITANILASCGFLGISVIGLPVILILLFIKGMVVGFTVGFLVNQMGWRGFYLAFVSILPQNIFIIPVFIMMARSCCFTINENDQKAFTKKFGQPLKPIIITLYFHIGFVSVIFNCGCCN